MVSAEMFEMIDLALRLARNVDTPYGGVLLVSVGDFYQVRLALQPSGVKP